MPTTIDPTYEHLLATLQQVEADNEVIATGATQQTGKDLLRVRLRADAAHLYKTDVPLFLTILFELLKIDMPDDDCDQLFETQTGFVYNVITVKGAIGLLTAQPELVRSAFRDHQITTANLGRFQDLIAECDKFTDIANKLNK